MLKAAAQRTLSLLPAGTRLWGERWLSGTYDTLAHARWSGSLVTGALREDGRIVRVLLLDDAAQYKFWIARILDDRPAPKTIGRVSIFQLMRRSGPVANCDLVLCPVNPILERILSRRGFLIVPRFVDCILDLSRPLADILKRRGIKRELQSLRRYGYEFGVDRSPSAFDEFFHEMLAPTAARRHQELAHQSSYEELREAYRSGCILTCHRSGEWLGGFLLLPHADGVLRAANGGWRGGSDELMKEHIFSALMHELIRYAKCEGHERLHLGSSVPFVDDGPLRYKLKWGAQLELPANTDKCGALVSARPNLAAGFGLADATGRALLHRIPLLVKREQQLQAVGWDLDMRPEFRNIVQKGLPWVDLRVGVEPTSSA
jgi:hypothetical protein